MHGYTNVKMCQNTVVTDRTSVRLFRITHIWSSGFDPLLITDPYKKNFYLPTCFASFTGSSLLAMSSSRVGMLMPM